MIVTDTASYSDIVFGLLTLAGFTYAPQLADLPDQKMWRIDRKAATRSPGTTSTCSAGAPSNFPSCPAACGPCAIRTRRTRSERRRRVRATVRGWSRGSVPTLSARQRS
jgi:hypothetical protein